MKKILLALAILPCLMGARFVEPTEHFATVEFTQSGDPQGTFHRNGKDCSGAVTFRGCHVATSFTPAEGAVYRVDLNGAECRVDVFVQDGAGNQSPEASARARVVKPPFRAAGPFCKADA